MKRRRVKITGIGPVTPAGIGRAEFEKGIFQPVSRVREFSKLDPALGPFVAAYIEKFDISDYISPAALPKGSARHTLFAIAGAALALKDAGVTSAMLNDSNCVVVVGACVMDFEGIGKTVEGVISKGVRGASGRVVYTTNAACIAASIAHALAIDARTMAVQSSCCTGLDAIGHAVRLVESGEADIAICGGTDAPLYRCPLVELRAIGMTPATNEMPMQINRPFDLWRTTGVVAEGASIFIIEPENSPRAGYSFLTGYSYGNDQTGDLCGGMVFAMKRAMADARIRLEEVDAISAWGPGHKLIDAAEARALTEVFGSRLNKIPASSIKGSIGNPLGAAGAVQVAAAAIGQRRGILTPTVNWEFADPACPLNLSVRAREIAHEVVLVNGHGLSGVNASLVMQKC